MKKGLFFLFCFPYLLCFSATIYDDYLVEAAEIVATLTLREKIGQMILPSTLALTNMYAPGGLNGAIAAWATTDASKELGDALGFDAITTYNIGAVYQAGGPLNYASTTSDQQDLAAWQKLTDTLQLYATLDMPLLIGSDAIHGNQHITGSILFPQSINLGATYNPDLIELVAAWTAYDVVQSGFNWSFMPTLSMADDLRWGRFYEGFGENVPVMKALSFSYISGLQQIADDEIKGVVATAKHFFGDGNTSLGVDEGFTYSLSEDTAWETFGLGYESAVAAQVGSIMASYSSLNGVPMHFGGAFGTLGKFRSGGITSGGETYALGGFVVSDYDGVARAAFKSNILSNTILSLKEMFSISINAGIDLFMISSAAYQNPFAINDDIQNTSPPYYTSIGEIVDAIEEAVEDGLISVARIDDAVTRILQVKLATNFDLPPEPATAEADVALAAAQQSLVLLKNEGDILPIAPADIEHVFLMGYYNDIGMQNGGWTINWQGQKGNEFWMGAFKDSSHATTILDGVQSLVPGGASFVEGEQAIMADSLDGVDASNSIAIVAIGEFPYAEYMGDIQNQNPWYAVGIKDGSNLYAPPIQSNFLGVLCSPEQEEAIAHLRTAGVPIVFVLFSGRPVVITEGVGAPLPLSDAFIAAFLPATSGGQAIANAIFGEYSFGSVTSEIDGITYRSNALPFAWPASMREVMEQTPTLFPVGYGLQTF